MTKLVIVGCGCRGLGFADFIARNADRAELVAIAEPREHPRRKLAAEHRIPRNRVFEDWRELARQGRIAGG